MSGTWHRGAPEAVSEDALRAALVAAGATLARRQLVRAREGNLSARLSRDEILLTPRDVDKGSLTGASLLRVALVGDPPPGASSEVWMHILAYRTVPAAAAVVHAHPPALLALDAAGRRLETDVLKEAKALLPAVARIGPVAHGSRELAKACAAALVAAPLVVMPRHGAVARGADVWEALARLEAAELAATIMLGLPRA
jgi:L-fuculose-phosphate aldolase